MMKQMKKESFLNKFIWLALGALVYLIVLIGSVYFCSAHGSGLLLLWIPFLVIISSLVGLCIWLCRYRKLFEATLVWFVYVFFGFGFIVMAPIAIDRSLSTFIFFYAVEHGKFQRNKLSDSYKEEFFEKRFDDALKGKFLVQKGDVYKPVFRAKLYYNIFYPLGKITNTLGNYKKFEKEIDHNFEATEEKND